MDNNQNNHGAKNQIPEARNSQRRVLPNQQRINQDKAGRQTPQKRQRQNNSLLSRALPYLIGGGSTGIGVGMSLSEVTDYFL